MSYSHDRITVSGNRFFGDKFIGNETSFINPVSLEELMKGLLVSIVLFLSLGLAYGQQSREGWEGWEDKVKVRKELQGVEVSPLRALAEGECDLSRDMINRLADFIEAEIIDGDADKHWGRIYKTVAQVLVFEVLTVEEVQEYVLPLLKQPDLLKPQLDACNCGVLEGCGWDICDWCWYCPGTNKWCSGWCQLEVNGQCVSYISGLCVDLCTDLPECPEGS